MRNLILFDRDGTLIEHVHHLNRISQIKFICGVEEALMQLKEAKFHFAIATNQSVVERGLCNQKELVRINQYVADHFKKFGIEFDFIRFCPHMENSCCDCRKPKIGMVQDLVNPKTYHLPSSFMVGDSYSDVEFGQRLGLRTVLIGTPSKSNIVPTRFIPHISKLVETIFDLHSDRICI